MHNPEFPNMSWPPAYTLKTHPRARSVKLKITLREGLQITLPPKFNVKEISNILEKNKSWIKKHLNDLTAIAEPAILPKELYFAAINENWKICYLKTQTKKITLIARPTKEIILVGDVNNQILCKQVLIRWTKLQAKKHLPILLNAQSGVMQLGFAKVSIKDQKSRWGSCSSDRNINLNYKLLFLPRSLTQHILIHELSHLVHMNHSAKFWQFVAKFDPSWHLHKNLIKTADKYLPRFVVT